MSRALPSWRAHAARCAFVACMAVALALASCNANKHNTALTRQYSAFITRYNIHYNGDKHYRETLADMEDAYIDDYTRLLPMHPIEAPGREVQPGTPGPFDRSIEKAQKAIQLRSIKKKPRRQPGRSSDKDYREWLKRDEYNPFLHNDWMLLGKSQYFNGDFSSAASTFRHIGKHFSWLPETVTEARLWQARSYVSLGWLDEADIILSRIKPSLIRDNRLLTDLYNYVYADYWIHRRKFDAAIPYLELAAANASGPQRTRLTFLLGQAYQLNGDNAAAFRAFKKAGSGASTPYKTKINARFKQSEVVSGPAVADEIKALKRMTRYDRNKQYLDQIYYAIGNLQLSKNDTAAAIDSYRQAIDCTDGAGLSQARLALGNLLYLQGEYRQAQPCYAEALPMLDRSMPDYESIRRRSDVLDRLAMLEQSIALQDSLLRLAAMSPEQQRAVAEHIVSELRQRERQLAEEQARNSAVRPASQPSMLQDTRAREFHISGDDSWYFYNQQARNAGKSEFQRRWGARTLEDDWRRSNKHSFSAFATDDDDPWAADDNADSQVLGGDTTQAMRPSRSYDQHQPEFYLAQIPSTEAEMANAREIVQESRYNLGLILKDDLDDISAATSQWSKLLAEYPDNPYRLDIYYNMYMMEMKHDRRAQAEHWRRMILDQFADTPQGHALRDDRYFEHLTQMEQNQERLYRQTYDQYLSNANDSVHAAMRYMQRTYPASPLMPQFMLLDALAYLTDGDPQRFNASLKELVARYPDAANAPLASAWLEGMHQGRTLYSPGENVRGMIWEQPLSGDDTSAAEAEPQPDIFTLDADSPQVIALVFPANVVSANELLYQVARHNFSTFVVKDFDLEVLNFGQLGVIVISGFDNMREVEHYKSVLSGSPVLTLPPDVRVVPMSRQDFDTLIREGLTFDDYFKSIENR